MLFEPSVHVCETVLSQNNFLSRFSLKFNSAMRVLTHFITEHTSYMEIYSASGAESALQVCCDYSTWTRIQRQISSTVSEIFDLPFPLQNPNWSEKSPFRYYFLAGQMPVKRFFWSFLNIQKRVLSCPSDIDLVWWSIELTCWIRAGGLNLRAINWRPPIILRYFSQLIPESCSCWMISS